MKANQFIYESKSSIYFSGTEGEVTPPILHQEFQTTQNITFFDYNVHHTWHSLRRASQRSINYRTILTVLDYGHSFYLQGMIFYTVMKNSLPRKFDLKLKGKLKDLIVVMSGNGKVIITCYKAKNAIKQLKHKSKTLY